MTFARAQFEAARMGLTAWIGNAVVVGSGAEETREVKRIGFADIDLAIGEGDTWEEALASAARIAFAA
jgi:hypothetical protein